MTDKMERGQETVLNFQQIGLKIIDAKWPNTMARNYHMEAVYNMAVKAIETTIVQDVAVAREKEWSWPTDWWQAFKLRWFPAWARRRWPVRMRHVQVREAFPEVPYPSSLGKMSFIINESARDLDPAVYGLGG